MGAIAITILRTLPPAWLSPWHELQQMRSQKGETMPAPAMAWNEPSVWATDRHTDWCCCPSRPPLQMAITRGRSSLRRYTSNAARLIEGGGGGARRGSRWRTLVAPGGGGGACVAYWEIYEHDLRKERFACTSGVTMLRLEVRTVTTEKANWREWLRSKVDEAIQFPRSAIHCISHGNQYVSGPYSDLRK